MRTSAHPPVIVVGAGASGLLVAHRLSVARIPCLLLEAGPFRARPLPSDPRRFARAIQPLLAVEPRDWSYRSVGLPYDWVRVRAGGGRTLLWGGWCARPEPLNFRDAEEFGAPWPFSFAELEPYLKRVERFLGVRTGRPMPGVDAVAHALGIPVLPKRAAVIAGGRRPAVALDWPRRARVLAHAVATRVVVDEERRARAVEYTDSRTGTARTLDAAAVVLCASPIETARLLLASGLDADGQVGVGLVDHLVSGHLVVFPGPARPVRAPSPLERAAVVPRFVNRDRASRRDYRSGFSVEIRGPLPLTELAPESLRAIDVDPALAREHAYYLLHSIGEAPPSDERYVAIDREERDRFGRPSPVVHFSVGEEEAHMARDMDDALLAVADVLAPPGARAIQFREALQPGGVGHEAGGCRMGKDPHRSATDPHGALRGASGVYVADASVMPTGLERHPTLTLLALALRTADHVVESLRRGG